MKKPPTGHLLSISTKKSRTDNAVDINHVANIDIRNEIVVKLTDLFIDLSKIRQVPNHIGGQLDERT